MRIRLHASVIERLRDEAAEVDFDHERGGWLFQEASGDETTIHFASAHDPESESSANGLTLPSAESLESLLCLEKRELIRCGRWHTHPRGDPRLSPTDERGAAYGFAVLESKIGDDRPAWVELVVVQRHRDRGDWRDVVIHGYVLRRDRESGLGVIEAAEIEEVD